MIHGVGEVRTNEMETKLRDVQNRRGERSEWEGEIAEAKCCHPLATNRRCT